VADDPYFLAEALAVYARAEELSDAQLAARLGCLPAQLAAVRLCRRPQGNPQEFQRDVDRIAERFQIDGAVIEDAVRLADALRALRNDVQDEGWLIAARDREAEEADDTPEATREP
jgi:hypothetical protein